MHERLGTATGASADGRLAGFPLGDGSGPAQGREHHGPTASILSSTCWNHEKFIGGIAVNLKFSKKLFTGASLEKLLTLVKTYMRRGGFELQINVVDREKLLAAQKNPDAYRDLVCASAVTAIISPTFRRKCRRKCCCARNTNCKANGKKTPGPPLRNVERQPSFYGSSMRFSVKPQILQRFLSVFKPIRPFLSHPFL